MQITRNDGIGVTVRDLDPADPHHIASVRDLIYREKIVQVKIGEIDAQQLLDLGRRFGTPERYYESVYHHPDVPDVFVSSNDEHDPRRIGVPGTGAFWHSDYQFMKKPFDITIILPKKIPEGRRGTYFLDLAHAYRELPDDLKKAAEGTTVTHSVERYFKIRPTDVYRPLSAIIGEVHHRTPPVTTPTLLRHPHTGETVLDVSEGFTLALHRADGTEDPALLEDLLSATGQRDETFSHPRVHFQTYSIGDVLLWDNRCLVHRAAHVSGRSTGPTVSYRVTVHDGSGVRS